MDEHWMRARGGRTLHRVVTYGNHYRSVCRLRNTLARPSWRAIGPKEEWSTDETGKYPQCKHCLVAP